MKKIKYIAVLLLVCAVFISGCGGKSSNIKLKATSKSLSDFYCMGINGFSECVSLGVENAGNYYMDFLDVSQYVIPTSDYATALISAIDFCSWCAERPDGTEQTEKIYQYSQHDASVVYYVHVTAKHADQEYTAKLYLVDAGVLYEDLDNEQYQQFVFTITPNVEIGEYEFTTKSLASGKVQYSKNKDYLFVSYTYKDSFIGDILTEIKFCSYENGAVGGRIISDLTIGAEPESYVCEFYTKSFYKTCKIGTLKDKEMLTNLKATKEDEIGVSNPSDERGYQVTYDATKDGEVISDLQPYGI